VLDACDLAATSREEIANQIARMDIALENFKIAIF
jgi:hypothetical protein